MLSIILKNDASLLKDLSYDLSLNNFFYYTPLILIYMFIAYLAGKAMNVKRKTV